MDLDWLWQSAAFEIVWKFVVIGLGGTLLTWAKSKWPSYATHVQTFLYAAAALAVLLFSITGVPVFSSQRTTVANIEANVKEWAEKFGLGMTKQSPSPDTFFAILISLRSGNHAVVTRTKDRDQYLQFQGAVTVSKEHQALLERLSAGQRAEFNEGLIVDLAKLGMAYSVDSNTETQVPRSVQFAVAVPITPQLTEDVFASNLDRIDSGVQSTIGNIRLALRRFSRTKLLP